MAALRDKIRGLAQWRVEGVFDSPNLRHWWSNESKVALEGLLEQLRT